jgi:hypothetical protein
MNTNDFNAYCQIATQSALLDIAKPLAGIVDSIIPHEIQLDALGALGALDRPTFPDTISKTRVQFLPNYNSTRGVDTSIPLRLDPSSMTLVDKHHFRREDEADLRKIWSIPTAIYNPGIGSLYPWNTTDAIGSTLYLELVGPNAEFLNTWPAYESDPSPCTALAYCTKPFVNWTGDIEYEVEAFASNGFHQGSLRIGYYPGTYDQSEIPTEYDKSSQYYTIMNISEGSTKMRFTVPFISQYPWLEINNDSRNERQYQQFRTTGLFVVSVAKQLRATGQAAPTISIVVRRFAGPTFSVANMTLHNASIQLAASPFETTAFKTQSAMTTETVNVAPLLATTGTTTAVLESDMNSTNNTAALDLQPNHPRTMQAVNEKAWDMRDAGNKQTLFASLDWTPITPQCQIIGLWDLPNDVLSSELNNIPHDRFVNTRADVTIQVEVTSSKFQSGALALVYLPCVSPQNFNLAGPDDGFLSSQTQIDFAQHILIHAGRSTTYKMSCQLRHPQAALFLGRGNSMGTLALIVYAPLATIAGVPNVNVMLHATLDNAHVTTPRPNLTPNLIASRYKNLNKMSDIKKIREMEQECHEKFHARFNRLKTNSGTMQVSSLSTAIAPTNPDLPLQVDDPITIAKDPGTSSQPVPHGRARDTVQHFEDIEYSISALTKKYVHANVFIDNIGEGVPSVARRVDIGNQLLFANGTGTSEAFNGSGLIGWYGALFRAFRGDIRIKIQFRVTPTTPDAPIPEVFGYVTANFPRLGTTGSGIGAGGAVLATNSMLIDPATLPSPKLTPANPHQHSFAVTPAIPEVVEIEIPYVHLGQFQLPPSYSGEINQEPYNFGFLDYVLATNSSANVQVQSRFFVALGDSAHFGIPTFLPRVQIVTGNYPDFWAAPGSEVESSDIDVLSESEEEYIKPVAKRMSSAKPRK